MGRAWVVLVVLGVLGASWVVYAMSRDGDVQRARIEVLEAERQQRSESVAALEAQVAFQERPEALEQLADAHLDLAPVDPLQVITLDEAAGVLFTLGAVSDTSSGQDGDTDDGGGDAGHGGDGGDGGAP